MSIILDAEEDGVDVELDVSYVVNNAHWTPTYDLRVFTDGEKRVMKVLLPSSLHLNAHVHRGTTTHSYNRTVERTGLTAICHCQLPWRILEAKYPSSRRSKSPSSVTRQHVGVSGESAACAEKEFSTNW